MLTSGLTTYSYDRNNSWGNIFRLLCLHLDLNLDRFLHEVHNLDLTAIMAPKYFQVLSVSTGLWPEQEKVGSVMQKRGDRWDSDPNQRKCLKNFLFLKIGACPSVNMEQVCYVTHAATSQYWELSVIWFYFWGAVTPSIFYSLLTLNKAFVVFNIMHLKYWPIYWMTDQKGVWSKLSLAKS